MSTPPSFAPECLFESGEPRRWLEQEILPGYISASRWFGGKARAPRGFELAALLPLPGAPERSRLALVRVAYADGTNALYQVPMALTTTASEVRVVAEIPGAVLAQVQNGVLYDALHDPAFRKAYLDVIVRGATLRQGAFALVGVPSESLRTLLNDSSAPNSRVLSVEQSNSSIVYGERLFLKLFRQLEEGDNPDAEILRFLTERRGFAHVPAFGGTLEFREAGRDPRLLALGTSVVPNKGDAWAFTLAELAHFFERVRSTQTDRPREEKEIGEAQLREAIGGSFLARAAQLGRRTGELHVALASETGEPDFAPEALTLDDQNELADGIEASLNGVLALLREKTSELPKETQACAQRLYAGEKELRQIAGSVRTPPIAAAKTRHHGDYHLGQVLNTGDDFVIIDFEGEPARPLAERRRKRSPLRDVAGMLRSFHYAAHSAFDSSSGDRALLPWIEGWSRLVGETFLDAWSEITRNAPFIPRASNDLRRLLAGFLLEKAVYEVGYELNHRPAWVEIPVRGLLSMLAGRAR